MSPWGSSSRRAVWVSAAALLSLAGVLSPWAQAQTSVAATPSAPASDAWASQLWASALQGDDDEFYELVREAPVPEEPASAAGPVAAAMSFTESLAKREETRAKRLGEVNAEFEKVLAQEKTDGNLSKAMVSAMELHMLSPDKQAVLNDPRVVELIASSERSARAAEARGDWLNASLLYYRLYYLLDQKGKYEDDVRRLNRRLEMLRLYAPQRLWELRTTQMKADGVAEEKLPPFNRMGVDFREKLKPVTSEMVVTALYRAATQHVERTPWQKVLAGALRSVAMLSDTADMQKAFESLGDPAARAAFVEALGKEEARISASRGGPSPDDVWDLLQRVLKINRATVNIPQEAIFHEFANGGLDELDEFSAVIWPDELIRFQKSTTGKFIGVGVQIEFNEQQLVRVVTPLDGTPAYRAGIRTGDVIKTVDGRDVFGLSLDQVVELITGPASTPVVLGIERMLENDEKQIIEKRLVRSVIPLKSVKGWKRLGAAEDDWEWFVDPESKIGYVRLTGFTDDTTSDFDAAISQMSAKGLKGLVLDLRFNPGGLLDQAVTITNRWVDRGVIVSTQGPTRRIEKEEFAKSGRARLGSVPTIVLINEGSASASEIVAGALQKYGRDGVIKCFTLGQRSYGKGSVQDVYWLADGQAAMKLTTQYYMLPDRRIIHRLPGAAVWGIEPDIAVEMLPSQTTELLLLRRSTDVLPLDEFGKPIADPKVPAQDPSELLSKGIDVQLQAALVLLRTQVPSAKLAEGRAEKAPTN
jgi:carboxyl-terminal processing protease